VSINGSVSLSVKAMDMTSIGDVVLEEDIYEDDKHFGWE
jgi:hypothetical protein